MFRVRKSFFGGNAILQCGRPGAWQDADSTVFLEGGFFILSEEGLRKLQDRAELAELRAKRMTDRVMVMHELAIEQARRRKKKLPVLTEFVVTP